MNKWFDSYFASDDASGSERLGAAQASAAERMEEAATMRLATAAAIRAFVASYLPFAGLADVLLGILLAFLAAVVFYYGARTLVKALRDAWQIVSAAGRVAPRTLAVLAFALALYVIYGFVLDVLLLSRADFPETHRHIEELSTSLVSVVRRRGT